MLNWDLFFRMVKVMDHISKTCLKKDRSYFPHYVICRANKITTANLLSWVAQRVPILEQKRSEHLISPCISVEFYFVCNIFVDHCLCCFECLFCIVYCPSVSSTNKTDRHDITEIMLKAALNTIKQTNKQCALTVFICIYDNDVIFWMV
jgi:hypothetical protein